MFWNDEELTQYQQLMESKGLPIGRMLYPVTPNIIKDVRLATAEDGMFWYGDLDMIIDSPILEEIQKQIGKELLYLN